MSKRKYVVYVVACETSNTLYTTIYRDAVSYFAKRRMDGESATLYGVNEMEEYCTIMAG